MLLQEFLRAGLQRLLHEGWSASVDCCRHCIDGCFACWKWRELRWALQHADPGPISPWPCTENFAITVVVHSFCMLIS